MLKTGRCVSGFIYSQSTLDILKQCILLLLGVTVLHLHCASLEYYHFSLRSAQCRPQCDLGPGHHRGLLRLTLVYSFVFQGQHGWDDYTMVFTWVCIPCRLTALVTVAVHYGQGLHLFDIDDPNNQMNTIKYLTIAPNFRILSVAAGKVFIVLLIQHDHGPIGKEAVFSYHCSPHNLGELPEQ